MANTKRTIRSQRTSTQYRPLDMSELNFGNIKRLIAVDDNASPAELEARHHTLMDRLVARQLARRV